MGKKKQPGTLGKSLISDRFGKRKPPSRGTGPGSDRNNFLHTSELQDGYDWGRLNLQSVTEQSNLEDFLSTAELAGTEFTAEKLNITFVDKNQQNSGLLSAEQKLEVEELQDKHRNVLKIPRRPVWDSTTTPVELDRHEKDTFLEWRRSLASLQDVEGIELTPYEKNLDFWRQLWRVIERSDVVVQIVDARNPLLFRCEDLEAYVQEVDPLKINLILINKADYLTATQRELWYQYFKEEGVQVAFWSAVDEMARQEEEKEKEEQKMMDELEEDVEEEDVEEEDVEEEEVDDNDDEVEEEDISERLMDDVSNEMTDRFQADCGVIGEGKERVHVETDKGMDTGTTSSDSKINQSQQNTESSSRPTTVSMETDLADNDASLTDDTQRGATGGDDSCTGVDSSEGGGKILNGLELLDLFRDLHTGKKCHEGQTTIGMVGFPNVGKSSSINAILTTKKVPVSATPGRTKHFQTLYVDTDLVLCDCPGLVFPSFVSTKADLVVNGILPIDQMRDHVPPTSLICQLIPKPVLEETYSINLPEPLEGEDPNRCPTAGELLNVYGYMRGYMTANGCPDCPRTSRYILKDFVNGKILYCNPPPDVDVDTFQPTRTKCTMKKRAADNAPMSIPNRLDREFFAKADPKIHAKGNVKNYTRIECLTQIGAEPSEGSSGTSSPYGSMQSLIVEKPWKKHHNKGKKVKLRNTFHYHDDVGKY